jgi:ferric iron reductase protein FhuF
VPDLLALDRDLFEIVDHLFDDHLATTIAAVRATARIGTPNLWGNVAAAAAGVFGALSAHAHDGIEPLEWAHHCAASGTTALGHRPELRSGGRFVVLSHDGRHRAFFERSTCCRWYRIPDGSLCTWCSRHGSEERGELFLRSLSDRP